MQIQDNAICFNAKQNRIQKMQDPIWIREFGGGYDDKRTVFANIR